MSDNSAKVDAKMRLRRRGEQSPGTIERSIQRKEVRDRARRQSLENSDLFKQLDTMCQNYGLRLSPAPNGVLLRDFLINDVRCKALRTTSVVIPKITNKPYARFENPLSTSRGEDFVIFLVDIDRPPIKEKTVYIVPALDIVRFASDAPFLYVPVGVREREVITKLDWDRYREEVGVKRLKNAAERARAQKLE